MSEEIKKQVQQELEQYRVEVQNKDLTAQITMAKETIIAQNQHIADLYSGMTCIIAILTIVVAIVGIAIPIWYANKSREVKKEFEKNIKNVDDFITNKFNEWENQSIDEALNKYLNKEIDWWHLNIVLKWKPMSFNHMKKIFDFAKAKGDVSSSDFDKSIGPLPYYLFIERKDNKSEDFNKVRKLIIDCKYLYTIILSNPKVYVEILNTLPEKERQDKLLDLLNHSDNFSLIYAVNVIIEGNFLSPEIEKIIANKILQRKDRQSIKAIQDNKNIIDILQKHNFFDEVQIWQPRGNDMQICCWNGMNHLTTDSYLSKELQKYKKDDFVKPV